MSGCLPPSWAALLRHPRSRQRATTMAVVTSEKSRSARVTGRWQVSCFSDVCHVRHLDSSRRAASTSRPVDGNACRCRGPVSTFTRQPGILWAAWPPHGAALRAQSVVAAMLDLWHRNAWLGTRREPPSSTMAATCCGTGHRAARGASFERVREPARVSSPLSSPAAA
jgi:hypothetical protein